MSAVTVTLTVAVFPDMVHAEVSFVISTPFLLIFETTQLVGAVKVNVTYVPEKTFYTPYGDTDPEEQAAADTLNFGVHFPNAFQGG